MGNKYRFLHMDVTNKTSDFTVNQASPLGMAKGLLIRRSRVQVPACSLEDSESCGIKRSASCSDSAQQTERPKGPKTRDNWTVDPATGCYVWTRQRDKDGYGYFRRDGKHVRAHRHFYELENGPIPDGLEPDHLCRNRACVNPDHIELKTKVENIRAGRVAKLTMDKAREIRRLHGQGVAQDVLAERFGVKPITIYFVVTNRLWREAA